MCSKVGITDYGDTAADTAEFEITMSCALLYFFEYRKPPQYRPSQDFMTSSQVKGPH